MTDAEQREAARKFIMKWNGYEKGEAQSFWIALLSDVLGVKNATDYIKFEVPVDVDGRKRFIDGYIKETHVLIEQKGAKFDLDKPEPQSGGDMLTPYEQANRYNNNLNKDDKANWIVTSNFSEIRVYNMNKLGEAPQMRMAENDKKDAVSLGGGRYKCPCGYIYDPAKGDPKHEIPAGTRFEDLPDDWRCPRCKRKREKFVKCE